MDITLPREKTYVAAISGGVDSMVLLDLIIKAKEANNWQIIVAHINHGIRPDSLEDKVLVESVAKDHNLVFESTDLNLDELASENLSRTKRYEFLEVLVSKYKAAAVITAHHQDDLLETAILNLIRGTGRKGLTSLVNNPNRLRPLINYPKKYIIDYARANNIKWREDSTNSDPTYLRNYVRLKILPRFDASAKLKLNSILNSMSSINRELDQSLGELIEQQSVPNELNKTWFNSLPFDLSCEVLATWFRTNNLAGFSRLPLERLVVSAKVASVNQHFPIHSNRYLIINKSTLGLSS